MKNQNELKDFFLVGPLQFETSLAEEISRCQPWLLGSDGRPTSNLVQVEQIRKGGLELRCPWLEGLQLVHHLKTPVRLLYRWKSKKITHVSELKTWIRSSRPLDLVPTDLKLKIQSRKSKLQNEKMIERVFHEDWKCINESSKQTLFVDVYDDQFTMSWDVCGEPLYKRSWAPLKGVAPIRENLAALLIQDLIRDLTGPELSQLSLVDPMMGSGTFLWEAVSWNQLNVARDFAYQEWKGVPAFLKTQWWKNHIRPPHSLFKSYNGFDRDAKMVEVAQQNSKAFSVLQLGDNLFLQQRDVLNDGNPGAAKSDQNCLLISNPPYGERLAVESLENLLKASLRNYRPQRALFVIPQGPVAYIEGYKTEIVRKFLQGGLDVQAVLFSRSC